MRVILFFISLCFLTVSCNNREKELFTVEMEARLDIPGGKDNIWTHVFVLQDIPSTLEAFAQQRGYSLENIDRVNSSIASLEGVFETVDYSNFDRIAINIRKNDDIESAREIFFQEIIPFNHTGPLQLFGSLSDIKPYLVDEFFDLEVEIRFKAPTTQLLENRLIFSFVAYDNE